MFNGKRISKIWKEKDHNRMTIWVKLTNWNKALIGLHNTSLESSVNKERTQETAANTNGNNIFQYFSSGSNLPKTFSY